MLIYMNMRKTLSVPYTVLLSSLVPQQKMSQTEVLCITSNRKFTLCKLYISKWYCTIPLFLITEIIVRCGTYSVFLDLVNNMEIFTVLGRTDTENLDACSDAVSNRTGLDISHGKLFWSPENRLERYTANTVDTQYSLSAVKRELEHIPCEFFIRWRFYFVCT